MKKRNNLSIGLLGEQAAGSYLRSLGFKIIEKNFKKRYGEIDIVAMDDNTLVFIEVKTRKGSKFGQPHESITPWKIKNLIKGAQYYKLCHQNLTSKMRIDAVAVYLSSTDTVLKIDHYKNITVL